MPTDANDEQTEQQALHGIRKASAAQPPRPAPIDLAIFLDLDGTLAPIAPTPDEAHIPAATLELLDVLYKSSAGSLAIVSGRDSPDIERLLGSLFLPYAALHGASIKLPDGTIKSVAVPPESLEEICSTAAKQMLKLPGTILERKTLSVALHYRNAPEFENKIRHLASSLLVKYSAIFEIQEGKMVIEIKPRAASKAGAIEHFMGTAPFHGRTPLFVGDDLTDEPAFCIVNTMGGISIKIGPGATQARWRFDDPATLTAWFRSLLDVHLASSGSLPAGRTKQ